MDWERIDPAIAAPSGVRNATRVVNRVLPWLALLVGWCTTAYGFQLALAAGRPVESLAPAMLPTSITVPATLDDPRKMFLTIWFRDRATGKATSMRCVTRRDWVNSDALVVDGDDALQVTSALCESH